MDVQYIPAPNIYYLNIPQCNGSFFYYTLPPGCAGFLIPQKRLLSPKEQPEKPVFSEQFLFSKLLWH